MNASQVVAHRKSLKLTQREVAERLGVSQAAVAHYESGRTEMTVALLAKYKALKPSERRTRAVKSAKKAAAKKVAKPTKKTAKKNPKK